MSQEASSIELSTLRDFPSLVREVAREGRRVVLREDGTDLVILSPAKPARRRKGKTVTPAQIEAAVRAFGGWKDLVDPAELKRERRELQVDDREPRSQ